MKLNHRLRKVAATALIVVAGGSAALAVASPAIGAVPGPDVIGPHAAVQCRIDFHASKTRLPVGQDLTLSWAAVGADKLTASWTTGKVPMAGSVTTTMDKPGTFSYQVTGTSGGLYCGGAGVQVTFLKAALGSSSSASPAPSTSANVPTASTPSKASIKPGNRVAAPPAKKVAVARAGAEKAGGGSYPTQSPTGGSGLPWYRDPLRLLTISALTGLASLMLWRRKQVRAVVHHEH